MAKVKETEEAAETKETEETEEAAETREVAIARITKGLPPAIAEKVVALVSTMDPDKPGFEEMGGARWSPPVIKVYQPTSGDAPGNAKQGDLYTDVGDMLERPWELIPVYMHYSHARFEPGNSNPTCRSEDGKQSIYGDLCKDCPDLPFRDGQRTNCNKSIDVYAFDKECGKLYRLQFSKTSYRAGSKLYRQASSSPVPWARVYALDTQEKQRQNDTGKYYVLTITPTGEQVDQQFFPWIEFVYGEISKIRKKILANVEDRASTGQKIVDNLPSDFGGEAQESGEKKGGMPDFSDM